MKQHKFITKILVATMLLLCFAAVIYAQMDKSSREKMMQQGREMWQQRATQMRQGMLCKANDLVGSEVKTRMTVMMEESISTRTEQETEIAAASENEKLGTVKDLIIDENQDKAHCVIVESEGKYHPVPWWAFDVQGRMRKTGTEPNDSNSTEMMSEETGQKPTLFLNISKETFQQSPTVESLTMENLNDKALGEKIMNFYSQQMPMKSRRHMMMMERSGMQSSSKMMTEEPNAPADEMKTTGTTQTQMNLMKTSEITGFKVQNTQNADIGTVKDMVIDTRNGQIAYGLIGFGGFAGIGEKIAAVPWTSLTFQPQQKIAKIDATQQMLEASVLEHGNIEKLSQQQFARKIYEDFGAQPYWEVMGFVPGEMPSMTAWAADSTYNRNFDPYNMVTIEGTIQNVSTFEPQTGAAPGTQLTIKTDKGETMTVQAGPQMYTRMQGITFKEGNQVELTGSKVQMQGQTVIMATKITSENKTLNLRDSQGKPMWTMRQQKSENPKY